MELILSAISAGGVVGAANQYMCLVVVSVAAKAGFITLTPQFAFMESWWFLILVGLFWVISVAPAYSSLLGGHVMSVINTVANFLHGFIVPVSSGLIALASVGVITNIDPELKNALSTLQVLNPNGDLSGWGWVVAGGGAAAAVTLTSMKALAKPAISVSSGTAGTLAPTIFATIETAAALLVMGAVYVLSKINPWLIVALIILLFLAALGALAFAVYQLVRLKRGIGRMFYMLQVAPRAGLAVLFEFLIWGTGWLIWKKWARGGVMFVFFGLFISILVIIFPLLGVVFAFFPPLIGLAWVTLAMMALGFYLMISFGTTGALMQMLDKEVMPIVEGSAMKPAYS